jgi:hypothetical protein
MWQHTNANCYEVSYGGETRDVEFINRHWYWLNWDDQRGKDGAYTINPAYDFIIAPKEYGLGTEEDHYREEGETNSDTASKDEEHQPKQEMHQVAEAVLLVEAEVEAEEAVLHNLLEEERTLLNSNQHWQYMHPLMEC